MISGYHAQLDAHALGLTFEALVFVTMRGADHDTIDTFERAVVTIANIVQAQRPFGDPDYLLRVFTRDLPDFQPIYDKHLATLPGVQRLSSTLVMKASRRTGRSRCQRQPPPSVTARTLPAVRSRSACSRRRQVLSSHVYE